MFRLFQHKLTQLSGEMVGTHHYSVAELRTRAEIVGIAAVFSFLGAQLNDPESIGCTTLTVAIAAGLFGAVLAYDCIAVQPLVEKQTMMRDACKGYLRDIADIASDDGNLALQRALSQLTKVIMTMSLSNERCENVSQTWGHRLALLQKICTHLESITHDERMDFYLAADAKTVIENLNALQVEPLTPAYRFK